MENKPTDGPYAAYLARQERIKELREELARLVREDTLYFGTTQSFDEVKAECLILIRKQQYADAIKLARAKLGIGLIEAKDLVDGWRKL